MTMTRSWIAAALLLVAAGVGTLGQEATQTESVQIQLEGRKTWTVRYGLGDPLALSGASIGDGQLKLDQTLWVDFSATALSIFRVEGHFDDQESDELQSLSLYLDTESVHGVLGDFTAPSLGSFFAGSRTMTGAKLDVSWSGGEATGIVSQLAGTRETREFVGDRAFGERTFAGTMGDEGVVYSTSLEGYGYIELREAYVVGFSETRATLAPAKVSGVLATYGVSELAPCLVAFPGRLVDEREATVVDAAASAQTLVLRIPPGNLVRETIRDAIRGYNKTGVETPLAYPFVVGSQAEKEFLAALVPLTDVLAGTEARTLGELRWRRFFDLGQEDVEPDSVATAVRLRGEFIATDDPRLTGYAVRVRAAEGLLDVEFPAAFFDDRNAALRASFAYRVVGGTYFLGMSIIPGSERVTMAGKPLVRDVDYTIDYEYGVLGLVVEIGPDVPLSVEFERYGGPGGGGAYARTFYGVTASVPVSDEWSLVTYALRAVDDRGSAKNPESVRVMPNAQTVVGVSGQWTRQDLTADFDLGYTNDIFPYDDNARVRTPNRVRTIAAAGDDVFVGTDVGFSARVGGAWRAYDAGSGLSGREVRSVAADGDAVYFGTEGGLTVVRLAGVSPLDKVANWSRYGEKDGLLEDSIRVLLLDGESLWIGSDSGLTRVAVAELDDPEAWTSYEHAALIDIRALAMADGVLYVGTEGALVRFDPASGQADVVGTPAAAVASLAVDGATVYAAGRDGVRTIVAGAETGWVVRDRAVDAVSVVEGDVLCGTSDGLWSAALDETLYSGWAITALAAAGGGLWVGSAGNPAGELLVWHREAGDVAYGVETTKINPWNPRRYQDAVASEHTTSGWLGRAAFAYQGDGYAISGDVDRIFPGFRAIDGRGRTSTGGWSVASDIDVGDAATVSFDHEVRLSDIGSGDERSTIEQSLTFRGSFGPEVTAGAAYRADDTSPRPGYERDVVSYNLGISHSMFEDALRVSVSWDEALRWDDGLALRRDTNLSTQATLELLPNISTTVSWRRPARLLADSVSGNERLTCATTGTFDVAGVDIAASYDVGTARSLPRGTARWEHAGTLAVSSEAFAVAAASVSPTLDLGVVHKDDATSLSGRLGLRVGVGDLATRTTASVDVAGLGTNVLRWTEKLAASATYSGVAGLRPSLNYNGTRNVTEVEGKGTKLSTTHSLSGRLTWSGPGGASETLAIAARLQSAGTASVTLDNTFLVDITESVSRWIPALRAEADVQTGSSVPAAPAEAAAPGGHEETESTPGPTVALRTDVGGEWRRQAERDEAGWRAGAAVDVALSPTWTLSLGATYRGGVRTAVVPFHGLVLEMTVAIDFKR